MKSHPRRLLVFPPALEMVQKLQERLLHDIFRVLVVAQQDRREAIHGRAVLLEEVLCRLRCVRGRVHLIGCHRYNAAAAGL